MIWRIGDVVLHSGGRVEGRGDLADEMRSGVASGNPIAVMPHPMDLVPLDPSSDYMLDCYARQMAHLHRERLETEYEPDVEDAPEEIRGKLKTWMSKRDLVPFGTVH